MSYHKKIPMLKQNFLPRCHWNKQHGKRRRAKRPFESEEDARNYINDRHLTIYNIYKCSVCGKYHIGHKN